MEALPLPLVIAAVALMFWLSGLNDTMRKRSGDNVKIAEANRDAAKYAADKAKHELEMARLTAGTHMQV